MDSSIRSLSKLAIANRDQKFEIEEIGDEKGVDISSGIKDCLLPNVVL